MTITQILLRRGTTTEWVANNIVLEFGEPAVERRNDGTIIMKIGDGIHPWNELPALGENKGGVELIDPSRFTIEELLETEKLDLKDGLPIGVSSIWSNGSGAWSHWFSIRRNLPENVLKAIENIEIYATSGSNPNIPYGKLISGIEDRGTATNNQGQETRVFAFNLAIMDDGSWAGTFNNGLEWEVEISTTGSPSGQSANMHTSASFIRFRPNHSSMWYSTFTFMFYGSEVLEGITRVTGQRLVPSGFTLDGLYRVRIEKEITILNDNAICSCCASIRRISRVRAEALVSTNTASGGGLVNADYFCNWHNHTTAQPIGIVDMEIANNEIVIRSSDFMGYGDNILLLINKWQVEKIGG